MIRNSIKDSFLTAAIIIMVCFVTNKSYGQWGLTKAIIISNGHGQLLNLLNPETNLHENVFTGLFNGTVDGNPAMFYSCNFQNAITLPDTNYSDSNSVSDPRVLFILNNYFPYKSNYPGILNNSDDETSSIQLAIWSLSYSLNINVLNNATLRDRALSIVSDAVSNSGNIFIPLTVSIIPDIDPDFFLVKTTDESGNLISVNNIHLSLSQSGGYLSTENVNTVNGYSEPVEVIGSGIGIIEAEGNFIFPQGIRFEERNRNKRSLILAKPVSGRMKTNYDWGALPVELASFSANAVLDEITLNWSTFSEINNSGFCVERSYNNSEWIYAGFVTENGTTGIQKFYSYKDKGLNPGRYSYRLKQTDYNGNFEYFYLNQELVINSESEFFLFQNYPNPFNPVTVIAFQLAFSSNISIIIYDAKGNEVKTLINERKNSGSYKVQFDGTDYPSGIYYCRIKAGRFAQVRKMMLIK